MSPPPSTPEKKSAPLPQPATSAAPPPPHATKAAKAPDQTGSSSMIPITIGLILFAGVVYFFGIAPRLTEKANLDQEQKLSTDRIVVYALARQAAPTAELSLPGTLDAYQQASIYARTNGYVKRWLVDIGDVVHEGDLLAELDTPEVDQQLNEAKATVEQAKATLVIAQETADRWDAMVKAHAVSQQEADEKNSTRDEDKANLDADVAVVDRLTDLQNFKEIRAPFTGTVTHRDIEVGNLVVSGNGTGTHELYRIAQTDPLRLYIDVPEANAPAIRPGVKATLHVQSYPDRAFEGTVVRSAGAIDNTSHTLETEVDVANHDGALLPGTFAEVRLALTDSKPTILIPANTLIVNSAGTQVALLAAFDESKPDSFKVHLLPVRVGRDLGTEVEILNDLKDGDRLVTNPPADLNDGMTVTGKPLPKPPAPAPLTTVQKT